MEIIYHITTPELFEQALQKGRYSHPSLEKEGFIHCSSSDQLAESAAKHFKDHERIVLLHIRIKAVRHILKMEKSRNDEQFPHIYSTIPMEAVHEVEYLERGPRGEFEF